MQGSTFVLHGNHNRTHILRLCASGEAATLCLHFTKIDFHVLILLSIELNAVYVYTKRMSEKNFTVLDLLDLDLKGQNSLNLRCIAGRRGLSKVLRVPDVNRPGLALSGFYDSFAYKRVQLFGRGEYAYLKKLEAEGKTESIKNYFSKIHASS